MRQGEDLTKLTMEELIELRAKRMEHYIWLAHFTYDDGDSDWYYQTDIWPIDDEIKKRAGEEFFRSVAREQAKRKK